MRAFQELLVWRKAHQLTLVIYELTRAFPVEERFGLTSQVRRSAASVAANIAEGCSRESEKDFANFLRIALGSATETEYHLLLARDLGYLSGESHDELREAALELQKMLSAFIRRLNSQRKSLAQPNPINSEYD